MWPSEFNGLGGVTRKNPMVVADKKSGRSVDKNRRFRSNIGVFVFFQDASEQGQDVVALG
jgi:hypothetical protein